MTSDEKTVRLLSSKYTFFYKYLLIVVWLAGFGFGTRDVLFSWQPSDERWLQYLLVWLGVALLIYLLTGSIKLVKLHQQNKQLVVSNFLKTEHIPLSRISGVDGSKFLSPKLVWITLSESGPFGSKIVFMPANGPSRSIGTHPLVIELLQEFGLNVTGE